MKTSFFVCSAVAFPKKRLYEIPQFSPSEIIVIFSANIGFVYATTPFALHIMAITKIVI